MAEETDLPLSGFEDFSILTSFAKKLLEDAAPIDEEIQKVINDHFWDML